MTMFNEEKGFEMYAVPDVETTEASIEGAPETAKSYMTRVDKALENVDTAKSQLEALEGKKGIYERYESAMDARNTGGGSADIKQLGYMRRNGADEYKKALDALTLAEGAYEKLLEEAPEGEERQSDEERKAA